MPPISSHNFLGTTRYASSCTRNLVDKLSRRREITQQLVRQNIAISVSVTPVSSHRTSGKLLTNAYSRHCPEERCAAPERSHFPYLITISIISKRTVEVSSPIASTATRYRKYRSLVMANWNEQTAYTYRLRSQWYQCQVVIVILFSAATTQVHTHRVSYWKADVAERNRGKNSGDSFKLVLPYL